MKLIQHTQQVLLLYGLYLSIFSIVSRSKVRQKIVLVRLVCCKAAEMKVLVFAEFAELINSSFLFCRLLVRYR